MGAAAVPDGVIVGVSVAATDHSPSQERMTRIAAMLRDADESTPVAHARSRGRGRQRREHPDGAGILTDRRAQR